MRVTLCVVAITALMAGCGGPAPVADPAPLKVSGAVSTPGGNVMFDVPPEGAECFTDAGFDDVAEGAQVAVSDASGKTLGLGQLGAGSVAGGRCVFRFTVGGVPGGGRFYGVEVARRGVVRFTEADLAEPVTLTVG